MQQLIYFTAKSLYMFRVSQHPSSVLKTVTAASGTGHNIGPATSFQRGQTCEARNHELKIPSRITDLPSAKGHDSACDRQLDPSSARSKRQAAQGGKQRTQIQTFSVGFKNIVS
jgi:hypothetical protein